MSNSSMPYFLLLFFLMEKGTFVNTEVSFNLTSLFSESKNRHLHFFRRFYFFALFQFGLVPKTVWNLNLLCNHDIYRLFNYFFFKKQEILLPMVVTVLVPLQQQALSKLVSSWQSPFPFFLNNLLKNVSRFSRLTTNCHQFVCINTIFPYSVKLSTINVIFSQTPAKK